MSVVFTICSVMLTITVVLAVVRAERGPSMLDRTVALDILTSSIVGGIALFAAWGLRVEAVPILVAVALVGFVGSVTIARFASVEPESERRILTKQEIAEREAVRRAAEEAEMAEVEAEHHGGGAEGEVRQ